MIVLKLSEDEFSQLRTALDQPHPSHQRLLDFVDKTAKHVDRAPLDVKHNDPMPQEHL